jgi:gluconolactonase
MASTRAAVRWAAVRAATTGVALSLGAAAGCIPTSTPQLPCSADGQCLPGYDCVDKVCVACNANDCELSEVTLVGVGGGIACGPDEVCVRIPRNALSSPIDVKITRRRVQVEIPGQTVLSKVYEITPSGVQFFQPIQVSMSISRFTVDLERVAIFRTDVVDGVWESLPSEPDIGTVTATTTQLGFFAASTEFGNFGDGGVTIPDAGPAMNPIPGIRTPMRLVNGAASNQLSGVAWDPVGGRVLIADRPNDTIYALPFGTQVPGELRRPSGQARGVAVDANGRVLAAEYAQRRVTRVASNGSALQVVADRFEGQRFNGPHDVTVRLTDGSVYFTDPPFALSASQTREIAFNGVYRVTGGQVRAEWRGDASTTAPAGLAFSPDFATLYVVDTAAGGVRAFAVAADGTLAAPTMFAATAPMPSGIACDAQGNVYVTSGMGLQVFPPTGGNAYGALPVMGGLVDIAFGGPGFTTLFGTVGSQLVASTVTTPGTP